MTVSHGVSKADRTNNMLTFVFSQLHNHLSLCEFTHQLT